MFKINDYVRYNEKGIKTLRFNIIQGIPYYGKVVAVRNNSFYPDEQIITYIDKNNERHDVNSIYLEKGKYDKEYSEYVDSILYPTSNFEEMFNNINNNLPNVDELLDKLDLKSLVNKILNPEYGRMLGLIVYLKINKLDKVVEKIMDLEEYKNMDKLLSSIKIEDKNDSFEYSFAISKNKQKIKVNNKVNKGELK